MASSVLKALIDERLSEFRFAFSDTATRIFYDSERMAIRHPREYGSYREAIVRRFVRGFIPDRLGIGSGFIVTSQGSVSTQCDLVIYDKQSTPLLESDERQRFFPVESVCAVGEVKSVVGKSDLRQALRKLSDIKRLRTQVSNSIALYRDRSVSGSVRPIEQAYDSLPTFLICKKFGFSIEDVSELQGYLYDDEQVWLRHNMVMSADDGLLAYEHDGKTDLPPSFVHP